ncbi:MAG: MoxR family ATPase, partial [Pseudomonadota bacterium]
PPELAERRLLVAHDRKALLQDAQPMLDARGLLELQARARAVHASEALLDYLQALVRATREAQDVRTGLSPRGALALLACARGLALLERREHLIPEDLQEVFVPVAAHRLQIAPNTEAIAEEIAARILEQTPVP